MALQSNCVYSKATTSEQIEEVADYYEKTSGSTTVAIPALWEAVQEKKIRVFMSRSMEGNTTGVLLSYPHYSTWVGESAVIRTVLADDCEAMRGLFEAVLEEGSSRGVSRFDLFSSDETTIEASLKLGFTNLTKSEDWHCYSLSISC